MLIIENKWRLGAVLLLIGLLVVTLIEVPACRRKRPPHPGKRFDRLLDHLTEDLGLTPAQRDEVESLRRGLKKRRREMHRHRRGHMQNIIALVRRDRVSVEEVRELDRAMERHHDEQKKFVIERFVRIHASLSPEQRKRLADRLEEVHRRKMRQMQKRFGGGPGRHDPPFDGPGGPPPEHGPPGDGPPEMPGPPESPGPF